MESLLHHLGLKSIRKMVRIRYKTGWIHFKTIDELSEITGWSFDRITFALRTKTAIMGIELLHGQQTPKPKLKPMRQEPIKQSNYLELKNELRMVSKRKNRADRVIKRYEDSWFPGRVETNEIKHARQESIRLGLEVDKLKKSIDHYRRYEQKKKKKYQGLY